MQTTQLSGPGAKNSAQINIAHSLIHEGQYKKAIEVLSPIVQAMDTSCPTEQEVFALLMIADAQRFNGLRTDAYKNYVIASELDPAQAERIEPHIFKCIPSMQTLFNTPVFERHLIGYLEHMEFYSGAVDYHAVKILTERFALTDPDATVELARIITDPLLLTALKHLSINSPHVELFLISLRKIVFQMIVENGLPDALVPIVISLAEHADLIEYAFEVDDNEKVLLLGIETLMETHFAANGECQSLLEPLLTFLMFEPISRLSFSSQITNETVSRWPNSVQRLFKNIILNPRQEVGLSASIPALTKVTAEVSKKVMNQYQENPYPRWRDITTHGRSAGYLDLYPELQGCLQNGQKFQQPLRCLVAGCGTGQQPISLAGNTTDISILAMDLSLPSLAYAKRQAVRYGCESKIEFIQGDILELDRLDEQFAIIQCTGVLHHMEDPELGLSKILAKLEDNGLLQLALYSRTARESLGINKVRGQTPAVTLEEIREQRARVLKDTSDPLLLKSRDFYRTSECRDLLNHVQEHQYDIPEIDEMLMRHGLQFLGFRINDPAIVQKFKSLYPEDADWLSLDAWHEFEQKHPFIFKGMYEFHCQKKQRH